MRQPDFWYRSENGITGQLLWPFGLAYSLAGKIRRFYRKPWCAGVPVICVGNLLVGGTGKTPTAIAIAHFLNEKGFDTHFLSRGYGKKVSGPIRVDPSLHTADAVGDEPLLLAKIAPTWVSADRRATAELAVRAGAKILVMDDGFQNPAIRKDISILVIDGETGFGNGRILPAGPLRESVNEGLKRTNAVLIIGHDAHKLNTTIKFPQNQVIEILRGHLVPDATTIDLTGKKVFAFTGIGRPTKFFRTLQNIGCVISKTVEFDDHHAYTVDEIDDLVQKANEMNAILVTTSKDRIRLDKATARKVTELPVSLEWENHAALARLLEPIFLDLS